MAAGTFHTIAEKRAHDLATVNRAASLDHGAGAIGNGGVRSSGSPKAKIMTTAAAIMNGSQSNEAIANATMTTLANMKPRNGRNSPIATNYFRPAHSEIRYGKMRFLITDRPTDRTIESYIGELERYRTHALVRVCEPTYDATPLRLRGISVEDWQFPDGQAPPSDVTSRWLELCIDEFSRSDGAITVHDVAGLGRAPLLVGIALLEAGQKCDEAIFLIRSQRRGALNEKQLEFLRAYKSTGALRKFRYVEAAKERHKSCAIM